MDDAVPMARDKKARQVVQDLIQRYGRDNDLVWSAENSAVLRRGREAGMALDVEDGLAWLERAEEAVLLGLVQAMGAEGIRLPDKPLRRFRAMMVVFQNRPPVGADNPVLPPTSTREDPPPLLEGAAGGGGGRSAEAHHGVRGDTHRGTMVCVAIADGVFWAGDTHSGGGVQGTYEKNAEQDVPQ